jgi:hypothetical protein
MPSLTRESRSTVLPALRLDRIFGYSALAMDVIRLGGWVVVARDGRRPEKPSPSAGRGERTWNGRFRRDLGADDAWMDFGEREASTRTRTHTRPPTCKGLPHRVPTRARMIKHARTRTHSPHPTAWMDGWPGCIGARAYAHALSRRKPNTPAPPAPFPSYRPHQRAICVLVSPRLSRTPANHSTSRPRLPKRTQHKSTGRRTEGRSPLIRPLAISPATLPQA